MVVAVAGRHSLIGLLGLPESQLRNTVFRVWNLSRKQEALKKKAILVNSDCLELNILYYIFTAIYS